MLQSVLPLFFQGDDLHWNMSRCGIELQIVEHRPAQHIRQENIQGDGCRPELARQGESDVSALGHQALEAFVAGQAEQHPSVVWVVLHDEQGRVARLNALTVVGDEFFTSHRQHGQ